ncbi:MAG: hypothetical protein ACUVV0_05055 [Anaerolineae bacterium]
MAKKVLLLIAVVFALVLGTLSMEAGGPVVEIFFFYSDTCPHCHIVIEEVLPKIEQKYGDRVRIRYFEISDPDNYALMLGLERIYGVTEEQAGIPEIFLGNVVMIGSHIIRQNLDKEIERYLAMGGFEFPELDDIPKPEVSIVTPTPTSSKPEAKSTPGNPDFAQTPTAVAMGVDKPIHIAYFYETGCKECDRALYDLGYVKSQYSQLEFVEFDMAEKAALSEWLGEKLKVPPEKRLDAPILFVGEDYLQGKDINASNLLALVEKYRHNGAEAIWEGFGEEEQASAFAGLQARFKSLNLLLVIGGGLIDGLNPCAFATIVFFISYLSFLERRGSEILAVGLAFTLGVFLTYFLIGLGFLKVLGSLPVMTTLRPWFNLAMALFCAVLAVLSLRDYFKARRGRPEDMSLRLPMRFRKLINRIIRHSAGMSAFAGVALITGFLVSTVEFACTGQVYIPIISGLSVPELRSRALSLLVIYNLAFIVPLVAIFLLAFFGATSEQMGRFVSRHTSTIKFLTALLFLFLAAWLVYGALPLLEVIRK